MRLAMQYQFRDDAACCGRVHDAVTAETIGEEEAGDRGRFSYDRVVVRRHLVKTSPRALRVYFSFFKTRNTRCCARQNLFDERGIKLSLEAGRLFRVVPSEQDSSALAPEVKACGHVYYHREARRQLIERLCRYELASKRHNGQVNSGHAREIRIHSADRIHDCASFDAPARSLNSRDTTILNINSNYLSIKPQTRAAFACAQHETHHNAVRINEAVCRAERSANDVICA